MILEEMIDITKGALLLESTFLDHQAIMQEILEMKVKDPILKEMNAIQIIIEVDIQEMTILHEAESILIRKEDSMMDIHPDSMEMTKIDFLAHLLLQMLQEGQLLV